MTSWSIAIKMVGGRSHVNPTPATAAKSAAAVDAPTSASDPSGVATATVSPAIEVTAAAHDVSAARESNFTIQVNPDDPLQSLYEKIELVTGLKAEQQRLIYRGRIISRSESVAATPPAAATSAAGPSAAAAGRVRDVTGLGDQQTIHLVPRPPAAGSSRDSHASAAAAAGPAAAPGLAPAGVVMGSARGLVGGILRGGTSEGGNGTANVTSLSGEAGMSLLAALLGVTATAIPSAAGDDDENDEGGREGGADGEGASDVAVAGGGGGGALGLLLGAPGNVPPSTEPQEGGTRDLPARAAPTLATALGPPARRALSRAGGPRAPSAVARARAQAARLTAADLRRPDPGDGEAVRQGLLTLHTLLGGAVPAPTSRYPPRRRWFRGQWLDVLDTVNQWLEATVVDVVLPCDVMPGYVTEAEEFKGDDDDDNNNNNEWGRRHTFPARDNVVAANDLEGRRRLLVQEPLPDDDSAAANGGVLQCRPRPDNAPGLQLLLVHYNGWPHRWDEWIRSDSPRLRPFRTRTRHRVTASTPVGAGACPAPMAAFPARPSTAIRDEEDPGRERAGMLVELARVAEGVGGLLAAAASTATVGRTHGDETAGPEATDAPHLPWRPTVGDRGIYASFFDDDTATSSSSFDAAAAAAAAPASPDLRRGALDREQLRQLAPLLDRLGRTLTDAAPHVAFMAEALPASARAAAGDNVGDDAGGETHRDPIQSLAARASHLYFGISNEDEDGDDADDAEEDPLDHNLTSAETAASAASDTVDEETTIDPDLTDYMNGMVNVSRGGNATWRGIGDRGRLVESGERDPLGSSLLASYLSSTGGNGPTGGRTGTAAEALGGGVMRNGNGDTTRIVHMGSGGGGLGLGGRATTGGGGGQGIDIHIHAVVTGSGMTNTGLTGAGGLGGLLLEAGGLGNTAVATATAVAADGADDSTEHDGNDHDDSLINHTASPATALSFGNIRVDSNEEDPDLFSELYSESPAPVNPHDEDDERASSVSETDGVISIGNLSLSFEECRSIEEEDDNDDSDDTDKEMEAMSVSSASSSHEALSTSVSTDLLPTTATDNANNCNVQSSSSGSLLALSEIESQESTATVPPSHSASMVVAGSDNPAATLAMHAMPSIQVGDINVPNPSSTRSPSFGNRIFRRTFGRLSSSSSRRSTNHGSGGVSGGSSPNST